MTTHTVSSSAHTTRTSVQLVSGLFGAVFLLVGILGFVPGITQDLDTIMFAGHHSQAALLGIFQVSVLHNIVHLLFGIVGLLGLRSRGLAKTYLIVGGIVYAVLWIYGLVVPMESMGNFVPLNTADNWLHFVLAVAMVTTGIVFGWKTSAAAQK
ncbi:MAG: DUF4383 domain-containing protein [Brevibacterium aurantiacum]|uniref:DUF4383 domain-containing protein n=1 Tax=Brevibacterium aurantiacum TaxID=273384 RepID=A0A2A3ZQN8_BREAU|nr:DUF4383 domain-containing protein [Brevibacterium aurantiacum]MDN5594887.1 DUF4383 domain-containing protein [Brevibacterium sp.]AZL06960.1 DUF4383 domain-containing protein [Brevibacterium aurantiacum]AZT94723.1 DUF4383 domain-containing protein [Brevibacterium aurantiacum]AZT98512.1 DUF4383 domain-containing protein [Brevibacterium aurantiacum]MDN5608835.1 DUF4383 domain-containing protein [Brevibacterium sp.]